LRYDKTKDTFVSVLSFGSSWALSDDGNVTAIRTTNLPGKFQYDKAADKFSVVDLNATYDKFAAFGTGLWWFGSANDLTELFDGTNYVRLGYNYYTGLIANGRYALMFNVNRERMLYVA